MIYTNSLSYPYIFSTISGKTMLDTSFEAINRRLSLLVQSAYMELFGDPDFGCGIYELTFDIAHEETFSILRDMIVDSIRKYEPTVQVSLSSIDISVNKENNHINITINYIVIDTDLSGTAEISLGVSE